MKSCTSVQLFVLLRHVRTESLQGLLPEVCKDALQGRVLKMLLRHSDEQDIPRHYIKYITDGISELRVNYGSNELRLFFFRDGDVLVILLNGFRKKIQKTPKKEIDQAIKLKNEYYEQK